MAERYSDRPGIRRWQWMLILLGVVLLAAAAFWIVVFRINAFSLSVRLYGEETMELDYGESYCEPGAEVVLQGTLFWKNGITPKNARLEVTGSVREDTLGRYTLTYTGSCLGLQAQAERRVCIVDYQCPVIRLSEEVRNGKPGEITFTAVDNYDGDITHRVKRIESPGKILFSVVDSSGNPAYVEWEIKDYDPTPPEIYLEGGDRKVITVGSFYQEPGYYAYDDADGNLSEQVQIQGEVDWLVPGLYPVTYTVTDSHGNHATAVREVEVAAKPRPEIRWPREKTIYLTFDDGPGPSTRKLLDILDQYQVKATFFVIDTGYGSIMKEIVDRGHSIGIHTVSHDYQAIYASPEAYFADLLAMQQVIYDNTGVETTLLRFPGGSSNTISRTSCEGIMSILAEAVQNAGFQYFDWNVDSDDAGKARDAETVAKNVVEGIENSGTSIVLQHDIHSYSVDAVEQIIQWGQENGYVFRALTENSPGFHHEIQN